MRNIIFVAAAIALAIAFSSPTQAGPHRGGSGGGGSVPTYNGR
jgi:hypothetical protein